MIKAVLFDLDMTLIDFMKMKRAASNAAAKAMVKAGLKMDVKKAEKLLFDKYITDIEGEDVFQKFLKEHNGDERVLAAAINAYLKEKINHLKPYPKVKQVLKKLKGKGIKIGIVTDAPRLKAYMRLDAMGIADLFELVVGREDTGRLKPSKLPFKRALKILKLKPSSVLHVGDWPERDVKGAKSVGIKTCLAKYGQSPGKYVKPDYEIDRFEEIPDIVEAERLNSKGQGIINVKCAGCGNKFEAVVSNVDKKRALKNDEFFCSKKCFEEEV